MKVSKLLVMAIVVLAVITMSVSVFAGTNELRDYVGGIHNINGMVFELTDSQKTAVFNYIDGLDDATADSILADIRAAEKLVAETGATSIAQVSGSVKKEVIALGNSAAAKAGLVLSVNTANNTFKLTKNDGSTLVSGSADALISAVETAGTTSSATGTTSSVAGTTASGSTLLYTGANYAVYVVAVLAIVAVAIAVRKRA